MKARDFAVLAEFASESADRKLTIGGIFDRIFTKTLPAVYGRAYVVAEFEARVAEGSVHDLTIECVDEDGQAVLKRSDPIRLTFSPSVPGMPLRARIVVMFDSLHFPHEGAYEINLRINSSQVASVPVAVVLRSPPPNDVE